MTRALFAACLILAPALLFAEEPKVDSETGFTQLFDGKTLNGWKGSTTGYEVINGAIVCKPKGGGFLYTDKEYGDFEFRFEFKLPPGANNGIGIRTPISANPAYAGMEIQVLDNTADRYKNLKPYQYHGSVYGVVAAKRGHLKPIGEWNQQTILCKGSHVTVILNGETIIDADVKAAAKDGAADGKSHPGLDREKGYICFCGHGSAVEFRNVRIQEK